MNMVRVKLTKHYPYRGAVRHAGTELDVDSDTHKLMKQRGVVESKQRSRSSSDDDDDDESGLALLGISENAVKSLQESGYNSIDSLKDVSVEALTEMKHIGEPTAKKIVEAVNEQE